MPRIGLFGGTFDPIHNGHLHIARSFADELDLESVILLPAGDPYHKTAPRTAAHHRLAMAEIAAQADSRLAVSDCDIIRQGATYTHDTVQIFRQHFPAAELWLLIGMDSLLQLHTWHRWQNLVRQCRIAAAPRPGSSLAQAPAPLQSWLAEALPQGRLHILRAEPLPISSSQIRQQLATGHTSPDISPEVLSYIQQHQLYCHTGA
jgi:nicotinate-nucleotide adenylyltransferase